MNLAERDRGATNDASLIAQVLAEDDRHAFGELVRRHQSAVRQLLRKLTGGDAAWADDLAQETFVKAYRGLAGFRGNARFGTWLARIAYHAFISAQRTRPPIGERDEEDESEAHPDPTGMDPVLLRHDLAAALATLSVEDRAVLALTHAGDLTHEEAAVVLDWPLGTVKTRISRAKAALRQQLEGYSRRESP